MKNRKYDHLILIGFGDIYKRALHFLIKVRSEYNYSLEVIENEPYPTSRIESICNENEIEYHKILDKKSLTEYLLSLEDKYAEDGISQRSLLISAGNKYIFPPKVINLSGLTVINFHNALLPKYPGRNAPSWAIYNGESEAGATWHLVTAAVDAGDILWQKACEITKDTKAYELTRNIMDLAYDGLTELLPLLLEGRSEAKKQEIKTTDRKIYYSKDTPANGIIRLTDSSAHVYRTLRAMDFGPNMIFQRPVLELQDGTRYSVKRYKKIPLIDKKDNEPAKCYYMTLDEEYVLKISVTEYVPGKIQTTFPP